MSDKVLESLFDETAKGLLSAIKDGVTVTDDEGRPAKITPPAAYFTASINFLRNNHIDKEPSADDDMSRLHAELIKKGEFSRVPTMPPVSEEPDAGMENQAV